MQAENTAVKTEQTSITYNRMGGAQVQNHLSLRQNEIAIVKDERHTV